MGTGRCRLGAAMNLMTPPEIADGGYWYVAKTVVDPVLGGNRPEVPSGLPWFAWYGNGAVLIRMETAFTVVSALVSIGSAMADSGLTKKPYARGGE